MLYVPSPRLNSGRSGRNFYRSIAVLLPLIVILSSCGSNSTPTATTPPVSPEELAKAIGDQEIKNYSKAVVAIEQLRKTTNQDMAKVSEGKPFEKVACTQPETISSLSTKMQAVALSFCGKVRDISEANGLTIPRFNAITVNAKTNPDLQKKINDQLLALLK